MWHWDDRIKVVVKAGVKSRIFKSKNACISPRGSVNLNSVTKKPGMFICMPDNYNFCRVAVMVSGAKELFIKKGWVHYELFGNRKGRWKRDT